MSTKEKEIDLLIDFNKEAHEMLATYLNIVSKSNESEWYYKVIPKDEFQAELKKKSQNL